MKENFILRVELNKSFYQNMQDDIEPLHVLNGLIDDIELCLYESKDCKVYNFFQVDLQDGFDIRTSVESSFKDCKELKDFLLYQDKDAFEKLNIERVF